MSQDRRRLRRELDRRAREATDSDDSEELPEPDTGGTTSPVGGVAPPDDSGGDSGGSDSDEIDPGSSPAPPGGVAPPDDSDGDSGGSDSDEIDPGSSPAPPGGVAPPDDSDGDSGGSDSDEIDPGSSPAPPGGVAPPDDTPSESPDQTDDEFYDPTDTQTSPTGGQAPPESTYENIEGVSSSREADIRQNVADQYDNVFYNDISLRREELSEEEIQTIRQEEAAERGVSPDRLEFEETPFRVVPEIEEQAQERVAEVEVASRYDNVSPLEVDVSGVSEGETDVEIVTEEAQAEVITQEAMEAQDSSMSQTDVFEEESLDFEEAQQQVMDVEDQRQNVQQDSFGQTTDPDFDPDDMPEGTVEYASQAIGLDIEEATEVTGETLINQPIESTTTGFETMAQGAGIDFNVVDAGEATGETLVNRPIESTETGFETVADEGEEGIDRTIEELEGGVGPGSAAVPAVVTGTSATSAVSTVGSGAAAAGALVAVPVTAGALGVRGISERDDVVAPTPETGTDELPLQEGTTEVDEIAVDDGVVQEQSEIDVSEGSLEEQPEITVEEGSLEYTPEIEVDEDPSQTQSEIPIGSETGAIADQPTGGFEDLPRDDYQEPDITEPEPEFEEEDFEEEFAEEEEEGSIGEQFTQERVSNIPLSEQQYLQEEIGRYEQTTGGGYVFPGEETTDRQIVDYSPELAYDPRMGVEFGSVSGTTLIDDVMPSFASASGPTTATDIMGRTEIGMEEEAIMPSDTVPEMEFEYPTPNREGFDYEFSYEYGYDSQNRQPRVPRLPELPEQESEPEETQAEMDEMFGFDIDVGSYIDIL